MEKVLKKMTLDFFGRGKHKISPDKFFETDNAYFLDVRSKEEAETITINLKHHKNVECRHIPINEVPDKIEEIPKNKLTAVFCSAGTRAAIVYAYLLSKGFSSVRILDGGYSALTEALKPGKILKQISN